MNEVPSLRVGLTLLLVHALAMILVAGGLKRSGGSSAVLTVTHCQYCASKSAVLVFAGNDDDASTRTYCTGTTVLLFVLRLHNFTADGQARLNVV